MLETTSSLRLIMAQAGAVRSERPQTVGRWDADQLNILRGWLSEFNTLEQSKYRLESCLAEAREALGKVGDSHHRDALEELTHFLAQQSAELGVN